MTEQTQKTAVITGASQGIGHATAKYFLNKGWRVITCARKDLSGDELEHHENLFHFPTDLASDESLSHFIKKALELLGDDPLHALVNNAGMSPKTPFKERLGCLNGDLNAWRQVFDLNFYAPLKLSRGFAPALHRGNGAIVNVTSIAGHYIHPFAGSAYSISKAALSALTREMANEFAEIGVRVNAVAPGEIQTDMIQPEYETLIPRIPLNRMGTTEEVAASIYYLAGEDSTYVTGTEMWLTGGQHLF